MKSKVDVLEVDYMVVDITHCNAENISQRKDEGVEGLNWKFYEFEIHSLLAQDSSNHLACTQTWRRGLPSFHRDKTSNQPIIVQ